MLNTTTIEVRAGQRIEGRYKAAGANATTMAVEISGVIESQNRTYVIGTRMDGDRAGTLVAISPLCFDPRQVEVEDVEDFEGVDMETIFVSRVFGGPFAFVEQVDAEDVAWAEARGAKCAAHFAIDHANVMVVE